MSWVPGCLGHQSGAGLRGGPAGGRRPGVTLESSAYEVLLLNNLRFQEVHLPLVLTLIQVVSRSWVSV